MNTTFHPALHPALIPAMVFLSAALAVLGLASLIYDIFFRHRLQITERLRAEFHDTVMGTADQTSLFKDLKQLSIPKAKRLGLWPQFCHTVEQSGLGISADRLILLAIALGWAVGLPAWLLSGQAWVGGVTWVLGCGAPLVWIPLRRNHRIGLLRSQLPDAFELMARAIQAGQTVTSSFQVVADNFHDLLGCEFRYCSEQQNLGMPLQVSLRDLARRTGVIELKMFAVTLSVQRQSGGNPVEMLQNLATVIRKRTKLIDRVKALTGEGRMQATVLLVLPFILFAAMYALNRSYIEILFQYPLLILSVLAVELCGALWIRQIIRFDY